MTETKLCRICLDNDDPRMIAPCKCKGTNKWIHRRCLDNWRCESEVAFHTCPTCKVNYVLDIKPDVDAEKERRQLFRILAMDIGLFLLTFSICSYFFGAYLSDCSATLWKHPGCESTNPVVLWIVGGTYFLFVIGCIVVIVMLVASSPANGGNVNTSFSSSRSKTAPPSTVLSTVEFFVGWLFFLLMAVIGMVAVVVFCKERINGHWQKHSAKRKRSIKVTDYVVRDLSDVDGLV